VLPDPVAQDTVSTFGLFVKNIGILIIQRCAKFTE